MWHIFIFFSFLTVYAIIVRSSFSSTVSVVTVTVPTGHVKSGLP